MKPKISESEILQWLRVKPQTRKWGAIVAYDREKTNKVLLQEYIQRFTSDKYLKPVSATIGTGDTNAELIYDYTLDHGRLSFENSSVTESMATFTMRVIGGAQISVNQPLGSPVQIVKVAGIAALATPDLIIELKLDVTPGTVNSAGIVFINISTGKFRLTFAKTEHERRLGGEFFQGLFDALHDDYKIIYLNEVKIPANQFLQPGNFVLRTHPSPNGTNRASDEFGEGQVMLWIAMKGYPNGGAPVSNADMQYLIAEGQSATMLLGHQFLMDRIFSEGCKNISSDKNSFRYELNGPEDGYVTSLKVTAGMRRGPVVETSSANFTKIRLPGLELSLAGTMSQEFTNEKITLTWSGSGNQSIALTTKDGSQFSAPISSIWTVVWQFEFKLDAAAGRVALVFVKTVSEKFKVTPSSYSDNPKVGPYFKEISDVALQAMRDLFAQCIKDFVAPSDEIDVFRLNSLLFQNNDAVVLNSAHFPGDLALFGDLSPTLTNFSLNSLEPLLGHGATHQFATIPSRTGVAWKVLSIPGYEDSGLGSISANGLYTAPAANQIKGLYTRVRVVATLGTSTCTALVSVVVHDISINPLLLVCAAGDASGREMTAGTLGTGKLVWSIADPSNGATIRPSTEPGGDHTFIPGPAKPGMNIHLEEVKVKNSTTNKTQSAFVVVVHSIAAVQLRMGAISGNSVQLIPYLMGEDIPANEFKWFMLGGSGSVNASGLFTMDTAGQHKFAVVVAEEEYRGQKLHSFIVLPVPLVTLDLLKTALATDFSSPPASLLE